MDNLVFSDTPILIDSYKDIKDNENNPFIEEIKVRNQVILKRFKAGEAIIPDKSTNMEEIKELTAQNKELNSVGLGIGKLKEKQIASFVLLYTDNRIDYRSLCPTTLKVLFYIIYEKINLGRDYIILNPKELQDKLEISKSYSYSVFVELINHKIISKRADNIWWINPNYLYAGNRLKILTK